MGEAMKILTHLAFNISTLILSKIQNSLIDTIFQHENLK